MGSGRDNRVVKDRTNTNKSMDPPTTKQRMPTSGSTMPVASPTVSSGTSAADVATTIDAVAKTLVSSNASNAQPTPRIPVKRPHQGSTLPNVSRAKTSEPVTIIKENSPTNQESEPSKSDKADQVPDEFESLFAPYRPVDGNNAASPSCSGTLSGGPKSAEIKTPSTATTTSKRASEASKSTAAPFNTVATPDTTTAATKLITTSEASRSLLAGPSLFSVPSATTTGANKPITTSEASRSLFAGPGPFDLPSATTTGDYKPITTSEASRSLFAGPSPFGLPSATTTGAFKPTTTSEASRSLFAGPGPFDLPSATTTGDYKPITTSEASRSLFAGPSPFGLPSATTTGAFKPFTISEASRSLFAKPSPFGVPSATTIDSNTASTPPKSLFNMSNSSHTKPLFGLPSVMGSGYVVPNTSESSTLPVDFGTAPIPNPTTVGSFGLTKMLDTVPTATVMAKSPFSEFKLPNTAPTPNSGKKGPFDAVKITVDTVPNPTSATDSPFFKIPDSVLMPKPTKNDDRFGTFKMPTESIFSKPNFPSSDFGNGQGKGVFATQSKINPFSFSSIGSSAPPFTTTNFGSFVTQTTNEIKFDKPEDLIIYQKSVIEVLQFNMALLKEQNGIVSNSVVVMTHNLEVCGKQLDYFSNRCNDLNDLCKERRQENKKLQEELDEVNTMHKVGKEKANSALEILRKEKDASQSNFVVCLCILVCVLFTWFVTSIIYKAGF